MTEAEKELQLWLNEIMTGVVLSKAMFEDYCKTISRLEGVPEQQVKERIEKRMKELQHEIKSKIVR